MKAYEKAYSKWQEEGFEFQFDVTTGVLDNYQAIFVGIHNLSKEEVKAQEPNLQHLRKLCRELGEKRNELIGKLNEYRKEFMKEENT